MCNECTDALLTCQDCGYPYVVTASCGCGSPSEVRCVVCNPQSESEEEFSKQADAEGTGEVVPGDT